jgi:D-alanine--poly(phosphoribitol) ligase subunit 2
LKTTVDAITEWIRRAAETRLPNVEVRADTAIIENGLLDSIEILNLVGFLEEQFDIALPVEEFVPENFTNAEAIARLVVRLRATQPVS